MPSGLIQKTKWKSLRINLSETKYVKKLEGQFTKMLTKYIVIFDGEHFITEVLLNL